jgi:hypothetical protein
MLTRLSGLVLLVSATLLAASGRAEVQKPDPAAILKAARDAIGGDATVRAIMSLRMTGTEFSTQQVSGGYTHDTEDPLDIRFALPDRFARITAQSMPSGIRERWDGFIGDRTITLRNGTPADPPGQAVYVRRVAAELLLILLARTESWGGLTFDAIGPHSLQARGLGGYSARLEFEAGTGRLSKLTYRQRRQVRPRNTVLRRGEPRAAAGRVAAGASGVATGDLPEVEIAITFHDHRAVDGILLPHRITTTAVAENALLWELRFEKVLVNPPLIAADFGGR